MGTNFKGLGALRTAASLLKKPEHDLARMDTQPGEEYVAFDFFVTAEHLAVLDHCSKEGVGPCV